MGPPRLNQAGYTLEDWKSWEGRWELIHGVAYDMTPSPSTVHQAISLALSAQVFAQLEQARRRGGAACWGFAAPTDVFLDSGVFIPDLLVVCDPARIAPRGILGAPELVVEILSPATAGKDLTRKRWAYEAAGVAEYLMVDPEARVGVLLRLEGGRYQAAGRIPWGAGVALLRGELNLTLGEALPA